VPLLAIVDSGADKSAVPLRLASSIGLTYDPNDPRTGWSAGGPYTYFEALNRIGVRTEAGLFMLDRPSLNPVLPFALFGRLDFFAAYKVTFDQREMAMLIEPHPEATRKPN
jgi:hypothetical protein